MAELKIRKVMTHMTMPQILLNQDLVLTNRHLMCENDIMMSLFFNLALHLKIAMVMKNLFV